MTAPAVVRCAGGACVSHSRRRLLHAVAAPPRGRETAQQLLIRQAPHALAAAQNLRNARRIRRDERAQYGCLLRLLQGARELVQTAQFGAGASADTAGAGVDVFGVPRWNDTLVLDPYRGRQRRRSFVSPHGRVSPFASLGVVSSAAHDARGVRAAGRGSGRMGSQCGCLLVSDKCNHGKSREHAVRDERDVEMFFAHEDAHGAHRHELLDAHGKQSNVELRDGDEHVEHAAHVRHEKHEVGVHEERGRESPR